MEMTLVQQFLLGEATVTIAVEDSREEFTDRVFSQLVSAANAHVSKYLLRRLDVLGDWLPDDGTTQVERASEATRSQTMVRIKINVAYSKEDADEILGTELQEAISALMKLVPAKLERLLQPRPDAEGFVRAVNELVDDQEVRPLAAEYGIEHFGVLVMVVEHTHRHFSGGFPFDFLRRN